MTKKRGIPEGWLPISAIGKPISGTRFLAFKVPLKETVCNNLAPGDRFSPAILLEREPNLRLVIDLTNTKRYYDKNEFTQNGVNYEKIFCPGREIPGSNLMKQFFAAVDNFMQSDDSQDKLIGVHCTHGINRTGFFICKYMVHKLGFNPDQAISAFQEARGHDIYRPHYLEDIKKGETSETPPTSETSIPNPHHPRKSFNKYQNHQSRTQYRHNPYPTQGNHSRQSQLNYYDDYEPRTQNWREGPRGQINNNWNSGRINRTQNWRDRSRYSWKNDNSNR